MLYSIYPGNFITKEHKVLGLATVWGMRIGNRFSVIHLTMIEPKTSVGVLDTVRTDNACHNVVS